MNTSKHLYYHIVLTAKYRRPLLRDGETLLYRVATVLVARLGRRAELVSIAVGADGGHLHMLVALPPTVAVADFIRDYKSTTSRLLLPGRALWGRGYWVATVGAKSIKAAAHYVQNQ